MILISGKDLKRAFDLADEWNGTEGTAAVVDEFESLRDTITHTIRHQTAELDEADTPASETVSDALEAYLYGDAGGKRPRRGEVLREIRRAGVSVTKFTRPRTGNRKENRI